MKAWDPVGMHLGDCGDQRLRVGMGRRTAHFASGTDFHQAPQVHDRYPAAQMFNDREIM